MKNDLTAFEKNLLKTINFANATNFTHKNFMEWSSRRGKVQENLQDGEVIYEQSGFYVAIKI